MSRRTSNKDLDHLEARLNALMEKTGYRFHWGCRYGYKAIDYTLTDKDGRETTNTFQTGMSSSEVAASYRALIFTAAIFKERETFFDELKSKLSFMVG